MYSATTIFGRDSSEVDHDPLHGCDSREIHGRLKYISMIHVNSRTVQWISITTQAREIFILRKASPVGLRCYYASICNNDNIREIITGRKRGFMRSHSTRKINNCHQLFIKTRFSTRLLHVCFAH
jgi:hypothetical protein